VDIMVFQKSLVSDLVKLLFAVPIDMSPMIAKKTLSAIGIIASSGPRTASEYRNKMMATETNE